LYDLAPCPSGWVSYRGSKSCYKVPLQTAKTWFMARKACFSMGGDLVVIESKTENDYVAFLARTVARDSHTVFIGMMRGITLTLNLNSSFHEVYSYFLYTLNTFNCILCRLNLYPGTIIWNYLLYLFPIKTKSFLSHGLRSNL